MKEKRERNDWVRKEKGDTERRCKKTCMDANTE
jgi:hypothetical protein